MIASILMGIVAGARSMLPLGAVAWLARRGELPNDGPLFRHRPSVPVVAGATALAFGEILGDKLASAPDRIVAAGMIGRVFTGALAGAALSHRREERLGACLGAVAASLSAYATFDARARAMRRYGQRPTGAIEDIAMVASAVAIALAFRERRA
ncbi:DUF4126 domain-containing protein [Aureimonas leprariae]|uniref:DUF4126 domain-containing protein n=1 Tax=Plantimonas leprariae TaxID=2615207 RepID=A0A7V7PKH7_9HYPH|nr:DUF4126 domain-containing protein [Aureimonas leprariae]KAB0676391.1 DUF4126 domain-containing protein [Aureimonas leprariae]